MNQISVMKETRVIYGYLILKKINMTESGAYWCIPAIPARGRAIRGSKTIFVYFVSSRAGLYETLPQESLIVQKHLPSANLNLKLY